MREFAQLVSWRYSSGANYLVLTLVCMFDLAFLCCCSCVAA